MGQASKVSLDRVIRSGYACVDSGATHDMLNGQASDFATYRSLPKGSHVLVADNHPIECLGVGTKIWRIGGLKGILWDIRKFSMSQQLLRCHCFRFDSIVDIKAALSLLADNNCC
jgi:hypothetical protein